MSRFLLRRLALMLLTAWAASLVLFWVIGVLPGDPGRAILGPFAPQEAVDQLNRQFGLDRPVALRYLTWMGGVLRGDWGRSFTFEVPVLPLVAERLGRSLVLAAFALALLLPAAVGLGTLAALHQGRLVDRVISVAGLTVGAIPEFVTGVVLLTVFAVWLQVLPVSADTVAPASPAPSGPGAGLAALRPLVLPAASLALTLFAYVARMTRTGVAEALASDYVRTAVLKGLPRSRVLLRHVLPNALAPVAGVLGSQAGWLVGGLVVVENLFHYPGLGSLTYFAAAHQDAPLLVGCVLASTLAYMTGGVAADLLLAFSNPRVRHGFEQG